MGTTPTARTLLPPYTALLAGLVRYRSSNRTVDGKDLDKPSTVPGISRQRERLWFRAGHRPPPPRWRLVHRGCHVIPLWCGILWLPGSRRLLFDTRGRVGHQRLVEILS